MSGSGHSNPRSELSRWRINVCRGRLRERGGRGGRNAGGSAWAARKKETGGLRRRGSETTQEGTAGAGHSLWGIMGASSRRGQSTGAGWPIG